MKKYTCNICGYVYDPALGDPENGVAAGTPFEKLPKDWVCPVCGASQSDFSRKNKRLHGFPSFLPIPV